MYGSSCVKNEERMNCIVCGEEMEEVVDTIAKKKTGHLWRCKCMPENVIVAVV